MRPDLRRVALDPLVRPIAISTMRTRHMLRQGRVLMRYVAAQMRGNASTPVEELNRRKRDAGLELLAHQAMRRTVIMFIDFDVIIDADPTAFPLGVLIGFGWQRDENRAVQFLE